MIGDRKAHRRRARRQTGETIDKRHYIHCRGGRLGGDADTAAADVDDIVTALRADTRGHLILYFHVGLVTRKAGLEIAERLTPLCLGGGHPVFYVWESGAWETIRNNLLELAEEPVFKQLLRKPLEYTINRIGGVSAARSIVPGNVGPQKVKEAVDKFFANPSKQTVPYRDLEAAAKGGAARSSAISVDEAEIQADLQSDVEFAQALAKLPDLKPSTRSALGGAVVAERRSPFSDAVDDKVSEGPGGRGIVAWFKVAMMVKDILVNVLRRHGSSRDHGLYATVVEEIVREVKLGGSGLNEWGKALQWNRMKQDTMDAFGPDENVHAGTALLARLKRAVDDSYALRRISLIGHSTGAIYIAHWLDMAKALLPPPAQFDVLLLAPAITYQRFDECLTRHQARIGHFRMFCMRDPLERDDQVWGEDGELEAQHDWRRFIYPSSLLYLVSGILESTGQGGDLKDVPDMPLLGMERFHALREIYADTDFPELKRVRAWLDAEPGRIVWSKAEGQGDGLNSGSFDHGAFDNDTDTVASLVSVLSRRF